METFTLWTLRLPSRDARVRAPRDRGGVGIIVLIEPQAGHTPNLDGKSWVSGTVQYGSGFLNGDGPDHLPQYATFDMAVGKSFGENWSVKLTGTNLTNAHYFIDLSNTFGGSHFAAPRMFAVQVKYRFHY